MFINSDVLLEEKLTKEQRDKIPANEFGIPDEKKFPLNDRKRVKAAITYFATYKGSEKKKKELAERIKEACKKYDVRYNHADNFIKYLNEEVISLTEVFEKMADENILKQIKSKYKGVDANNRNLISESVELDNGSLFTEEDLICVLENYSSIGKDCKTESNVHKILSLCETVGLIIQEDHEILQETNYNYKFTLNEGLADFLLSEMNKNFSPIKDTQKKWEKMKSNYKNIYVVCYASEGSIRGLIKKFSRGAAQYSHAAYSLTKEMNHIYGMNMGGVEHEDIERNLKGTNVYADIFSVRVSEKDYKEALNFQKLVLKNSDKFQYNYRQLLSFILAKVEKNGMIRTIRNTDIKGELFTKQICSSFVMYLLIKTSRNIAKFFKQNEEDWIHITPNRIPYLPFIEYNFTHIKGEDYKKELKEYENEEGEFPN